MSKLANIHSFGSRAATAAMELPYRRTPVDRNALAARCMR
jgi:hypothetical protein